MAQKIHVVLIDDLDQSEADETVSFGLDGSTYEIDLSEGNAASLREALAPYVAQGRRLNGGKRGRKSVTSVGPSARELRDWARSNGFEVSERGRVSAEIRQAFEAAH